MGCPGRLGNVTSNISIQFAIRVLVLSDVIVGQLIMKAWISWTIQLPGLQNDFPSRGLVES